MSTATISPSYKLRSMGPIPRRLAFSVVLLMLAIVSSNRLFYVALTVANVIFAIVRCWRVQLILDKAGIYLPDVEFFVPFAEMIAHKVEGRKLILLFKHHGENKLLQFNLRLFGDGDEQRLCECLQERANKEDYDAVKDEITRLSDDFKKRNNQYEPLRSSLPTPKIIWGVFIAVVTMQIVVLVLCFTVMNQYMNDDQMSIVAAFSMIAILVVYGIFDCTLLFGRNSGRSILGVLLMISLCMHVGLYMAGGDSDYTVGFPGYIAFALNWVMYGLAFLPQVEQWYKVCAQVVFKKKFALNDN